VPALGSQPSSAYRASTSLSEDKTSKHIYFLSLKLIVIKRPLIKVNVIEVKLIQLICCVLVVFIVYKDFLWFTTNMLSCSKTYGVVYILSSA